MALSGSYDFVRNRDQIITGAYRLCGVLGAGESPTAEEVTDGSEILNLLIKEWQHKDVGLWLQEEGVLFMDKTSASFSLGPSGDEACLLGDLIKTEIATAAIATAATLVVDSTTGMAAADRIGIVLDDGTLDWTTIVTVDSSTGLTITTGLTSAAAVDRNVYTYTNKIQRPLGILEMRLHYDDGRDTPQNLISRTEYMDLTNKTTTGPPVQVYYHATLTNGTLYVWPITTDVTQQLYFTSKRSIQDVDAATDDLEFPPQWGNALRYGLAAELGIEHGTPASVMKLINEQATLKRLEAREGDDDGVAFTLAPESWG